MVGWWWWRFSPEKLLCKSFLFLSSLRLFEISSWIRYFKGRGFNHCFCEFHLSCSLRCWLLRQEESCLTSCCTGILGFWTICQVSLEVWETENAGLPTGWWWNTALFSNNRKHFNYPQNDKRWRNTWAFITVSCFSLWLSLLASNSQGCPYPTIRQDLLMKGRNPIQLKVKVKSLSRVWLFATREL